MEAWLRIKVWNDLLSAKMGDEYISLYLNREKKVRKNYKFFLMIISAIGIGIWNYWKPMPLFSCIIILGSEIYLKSENFILMKDEDFSRLGDLRLLYIDRFNKLLRLWTDIQDESIIYTEAKDQYFILQKDKDAIELMDNKAHIPLRANLKQEATILTNEFINNYYG